MCFVCNVLISNDKNQLYRVFFHPYPVATRYPSPETTSIGKCAAKASTRDHQYCLFLVSSSRNLSMYAKCIYVCLIFAIFAPW